MEAAREISIYVTALTSLGPCPRIVCRYRIWEMTMRLIRFAIGMSLVAVSVLGSARAQSPAELSQVSGQEALTNRFESPISEMDRRVHWDLAQAALFPLYELRGRAHR